MLENVRTTGSLSNRESDPTIAQRSLQIAAGCLGVEPSGLAVSKLTGDASSRIYYRINSIAHQNGNARSSASLVLVRYPDPFDETQSASKRLTELELTDPKARLTFASDPCAQIEVTRLMLGGGLPVPKVVGVCGDEGVIMFEDLGDLRLQEWLGGKPPEEIRDAYMEALRLLVQIQNNTEIALSSGSICSRLALDKDKLGWELDFFLDNYFDKYCSAVIPAAQMSQAREEVSELCHELSSLPRVLTHRDYHARNLMMHGGGMYIIDHQDARMGPRSYDLVSLLYDPYAELKADLIEELLDSFIGLTSSQKFRITDNAGFRRACDLAALQRLLKAAGTYSFQAAVKKNEVYVQYLAPALETAVEISRRIGRFDALRALIETHPVKRSGE